MKQLISLEEIIKKSWMTFLREWRAALKFILPAIIIPILGMLPLMFAAEQETDVALASLLAGVAIIVAVYFGLALTKYFINVVFEKKETPWPNTREFFGSLAISILYGLMVCIGFMIFIVPGIWLAVIFALSLPVYLKEKTGIFGAMKKSRALVQNRWWAACVRMVLPNLLWQTGAGFVVFGGFILFATFGAIWFMLAAAIESLGGTEILYALNVFGGLLGIITVIAVLVLQAATYLALGIAQISILLETYKSLEETS